VVQPAWQAQAPEDGRAGEPLRRLEERGHQALPHLEEQGHQADERPAHQPGSAVALGFHLEERDHQGEAQGAQADEEPAWQLWQLGSPGEAAEQLLGWE